MKIFKSIIFRNFICGFAVGAIALLASQGMLDADLVTDAFASTMR